MAVGSIGMDRWRFSVEDYHRMAEVGIFSDDDKVELIEGEIIVMSPIGSRHASCVRRLDDLLKERLGRRAIVSVQSPIRLGDRSEPEPDLTLLRPRADYYASAHPRPADVFLVIEVMDTTADYDRKVKLALYAHAGVPEVWLIDLNGERVETHRRPIGDVYTEVRILPRGQRLAPEAFPDIELSVDDILG